MVFKESSKNDLEYYRFKEAKYFKIVRHLQKEDASGILYIGRNL